MRLRLVGVLGVLIVAWLSAPCSAAAPQLPDHPLALDECISLARQYNPSLVTARQDVVQGEANLDRARASYYPSALLIGTYGRTGGSSFLETAAGTIAFSTSGTRREAEVALSQTVWRTGRKESVAGAGHSLMASRASERSAVQGLLLSISQLYYAGLAAEQLVGVSEATLAAARDHEKLARARAEVGEGARVDVVPAEADVANAEFSLLQAGNNADIAKARLKSQMGVPPTYGLQLAQPDPAQDGGDLPSLETALEIALAHRPDAIAVRESVAAAEQGLRFAEATKDATISLSAQYDRGITGPREGTSWAAILSATAFLFDAGSRKADVTAARAQVESTRAWQQQVVNAIGMEVEVALLDVQTARKSVEVAAKAVAAAEAQLAAAEGKYREGLGIFVEILDAQNTVARARTNQVQARYTHQTALVALKKALGQLVPDPSDEVVR